MQVVLDACVLHPAPLRDFLIRLSLKRIIYPHWTTEIHAEWMRNLLKNRPDLSPAQLNRTCMLMEKAIPDALITGYEELTGSLTLPDPKDQHVLAATIFCSARAIITFNVKDFPSKSLATYRIKAIHPDAWLSAMYKRNPLGVVEAIQAQQRALKRAPCTMDDVLQVLFNIGIPHTVTLLREALTPKS